MNCTGKFQYLLQSVDDYNADNIYEAGNIIVAKRTGPSLSGRQASQAKPPQGVAAGNQNRI